MNQINLVLFTTLYALASIFSANQSLAQEHCQKPSVQLCDRKVNPYIEQAKLGLANFDQIMNSVFDHPEMVEFMNKTKKPDSKNCQHVLLTQLQQLNCRALQTRLASQKMFNEERVTKAKKLFLQAKKSLIAILEQRKIELEQASRRQANSTIQKMIERLSNIGVDIKADPKRSIGYFAALPGLPQLDSTRTQIVKNKKNVLIEGMITLVDTNPKGLYFILLHELGHAIGLSSFRKDSAYSGHPFANQVQCLQRQDSIFAKISDSACFAKTADDYAKTYELRMFERPLREIAVLTKINPDIPVRHPPIGVTCQMGQVEESWADWVAIEALNNEFKDDKIKDYVLAASAQLCPIETIIEKPHASHPKLLDRVNSLLSQHPKISQALGCHASPLSSLQAPIQSQKVYCGRQLDY